MNLAQKINEIKKVIPSFSKDKDGHGYKYVSGNQVLNSVREKMQELNVLLLPSVSTGDHSTFNYTNSKGQEKTDFIVWGNMTYTWVDGDNPEDTLSCAWSYFGQQDDISKAFGSGLTYSERYFLLKFFQVPTDGDDPDSKDTSGKQQKGSYQRPMQTPADVYSQPSGFQMPKDFCAVCGSAISAKMASNTEEATGFKLCMKHAEFAKEKFGAIKLQQAHILEMKG